MASTIKGIPVYSVRGKFGHHLQTFTAQLTTADVLGVLGHDPRSSNWKNLPVELRAIYDNTQRKTKSDRSAGTGEYIQHRFDNSKLPGAFPAICIGLTESIEFTPFKDSYGEETAAGTSWVSMASTRILLDGLARVTGALEQPKSADLENLFLFPTVLYAPAPGKTLTIEQLGQLFFDFNALQTTVASAMALALDQSDVYIQLANKLGEMHFFESHGGVERRKASLGKKSTAFTTQQSLVRTVRGAMEGRSFQESDSARVETPNLTWANFETRADELHTYFLTLGQHLGPKLKDRDSLLYTSPGLQVLGLLFNDLTFRATLTPVDRTYFIERIGQIDWSRHNPDWLNLLGQQEIDEAGNVVRDAQGRPRIALGKAGANTIRSLMKYIREKTELSKVLADTETAADIATQLELAPEL
ncbi:DNA sulfur modification protein DndB [Granulicella mallensis]|uniref:DGQHR domain protein n=1 Tax=Granulicella mallensis TaxID=940614 RepID=A0A7W8EAX2_9BACT|nr:DNA sulfur modification protein DndB [Granulicella mallensis]MBB5063935.1 hypothetical protein [Granulicella mallensis]